MYYRIFDQESQSYLPQAYNSESKTDLKNEMNSFLNDCLSLEDSEDIFKLPWENYVSKLKELSLLVENQPTPFPPQEDNTPWDEYLSDYEDEEDFEL